LNLEELRKSRKLEKGIKHLPPTAEFSGTRRIHFIFDRLLTRFPGDKRLWIQFIKFAKEKNTKESLGKIFAKFFFSLLNQKKEILLRITINFIYLERFKLIL